MQPTSRQREPEFGAYAYQVVLEAFDAAALPIDPARQLHAAMLRLIERFDRALSLRLYGDAVKPLVIGPLRQAEAGGATNRKKTSRFCVRLAALDEWTMVVLEGGLRHCLLSGTPLTLDWSPLEVADVLHVPLPVRGAALAATLCRSLPACLAQDGDRAAFHVSHCFSARGQQYLGAGASPGIRELPAAVECILWHRVAMVR